MKRKEQYADEIIEMLERTKGGAWASNINLNTKDRVIEVCQNCVDSWSGRKFKDHCTTPPQALEQTRWISVSEKLPEDGIYLVTAERTPGVPRIETKSFAKDLHIVDDYDFPEHKCGWYEYDSEYGYWEDTDVIAWMPLPEPYKAESEVRNETCD